MSWMCRIRLHNILIQSELISCMTTNINKIQEPFRDMAYIIKISNKIPNLWKENAKTIRLEDALPKMQQNDLHGRNLVSFATFSGDQKKKEEEKKKWMLDKRASIPQCCTGTEFFPSHDIRKILKMSSEDSCTFVILFLHLFFVACFSILESQIV